MSLSQSEADHLWAVRSSVLYRCMLSSRYHKKRERFFDFADRLITAVALIGGSSAFAAAAGSSTLVKWSAFFITVSAVVGLIFGVGEKARRHSQLAKSYKLIEADIQLAGDYDYTAELVYEFRARVSEVESEEPPALRPIVAMCQNEMALAAGQPELIQSLPKHVRWFGHIVNFDVPTSAADSFETK